MEFYDVIEQTKYRITISRPEYVDQLSDLFMTEDELKDIIGKHTYCPSTGRPRTFLLNEVITSELQKWADKLEASGKKTLLIEDDELLDVLKNNSYVTDFIDRKYGRHGDRICYARRYERKKTKPTKSDVHQIWHAFQSAFRDKFGCYPSHIPRYDRHASMFRAYKKILGWQRCKKYLGSSNLRFYKQIWDNPEEYV